MKGIFDFQTGLKITLADLEDKKYNDIYQRILLHFIDLLAKAGLTDEMLTDMINKAKKLVEEENKQI